MRRFFLLNVLLFFVTLPFISAQDIPKREMRAAWVTTVWGLDWPNYKIANTGDTYVINQQKDQMIALLDQLKAGNMNTIFFQIRSECDAMYQSSYEPWSAYLVAERGMDPGYDPLQFVIEEGHKRGMEVHAWLNPYRFESTAGKYEGMAGDYRESHPEWVLEYDGGGSILDPGNPEVRDRIADIVEEVITNYNVDGVVFDDYFYSYDGTPSDLDAYSQDLYKPEGMNLHDWRRDNVNQMVKDVYDRIQGIKPWVTFGVSPFGIWTTDPNVAEAEGLELPEGITGMNAYQQIYCDPVAWLKEGSVDYISPQLYWSTTKTGQEYDVLGPWWSDVSNLFGRHLYVSHSLSDLAESDYAPAFPGSDLKSAGSDGQDIDLNGLSMLEYFSQPNEAFLKGTLDPSEFGKQVQVNRDSDKNGAPGSVFFRASMFYRAGFVNYLNEYEFANHSLPPAINWKDAPERGIPSNLSIEGDLLSWESSETDVRYSVYAIPDSVVGEPGVFALSEYLLGMSYQKSFELQNYSDLLDTHTFAVAVLDRFGNEFPPALMGHTPGTNQSPELFYPDNGQEVFNPFSFEWSDVANSEFYILEIAEDAAFENIVYEREIENSDFSANNVSMELGKTYYWRVTTRMIGVADEVSSAWSFTLVPQPSPDILQPQNNATGISLAPTIEWAGFGEGYSYELQVSANSDFSTIVHQMNGLDGLTYQMPDQVLIAWSDYYIRVRAYDEQSVSAWSPVVKISTIQEEPAVPVILSPGQDDSVDPRDAVLTITEEPHAKSFTVQLSSQENFPWTDRKIYTMDAFQYDLTLEELDEGTYYLRVLANYGRSSQTEWSDVVSFSVVTTSIVQPGESALSLYCPTNLRGNNVQIEFETGAPGHVRLVLSDITGKQVKILQDNVLNAGEHVVEMVTGDLRRGLYFLTLQTNQGNKTLKLIK